MLIANYHTHTKLCNHAEGMPSDYVEEAIRLGFKEIGMSDHNPIPVSFLGKDLYMDNWCHRNMSYDVFKKIFILRKWLLLRKKIWQTN
ncbi:MAG: PHP domain-containing protein [Clostridium sp.]|nr:MAG: PHP domain-containing protein [Clostridium sp.]